MTHYHPNPLALFSLVPLNELAEAVLDHGDNEHLVSRVNDSTRALDIGFNIRSKSSTTLATLGRGDVDVYVDCSSISKIQCSFEIDTATHVTTQVSGDNVIPFEYPRPRRVVVLPNVNDIIGMGGVGRNLVIFRLHWWSNAIEAIQKIKDGVCMSYGVDNNPRLARTVIDEVDTELPTR
ncbi:hypothetical protein AJ80_03860 [Polytolypa hystricis UAMH7299]|uniref:Uncharacterized protein n=1 Tax=Polytolypa hystricis (strain UAMH7299) TaxID=1447883 RepID=A0A2B7YE28_POLH7|nr:hypothetical protein AJ80_03860 [Polytolypa hystricis UAMH7299]